MRCKPLIEGVFKDTTAERGRGAWGRGAIRVADARVRVALQPRLGKAYSTALGKRPKSWGARSLYTPPYRRFSRFRKRPSRREMGWVYNTSIHLNQMFTFVENQLVMKMMSIRDGLAVRNGRLINDRPDGMTGIQKMCETKKMMKREQKIDMMVEADVRASMREKMMGYE